MSLDPLFKKKGIWQSKFHWGSASTWGTTLVNLECQAPYIIWEYNKKYWFIPKFMFLQADPTPFINSESAPVILSYIFVSSTDMFLML